ncbi:ABC transporter permease [Rhodococcus artemisiae]|uniref:ABC transporter permease n=1 Tax=Rhodococcus artemisiae TaxID=714159 RepID=A0ABU7LGA5_9NOCA|nr:ABC transporter permease [Rhodococcus artemisiae]MEE2060583.1 ABC transporter permease [Rhodococcus artemisiae]
MFVAWRDLRFAKGRFALMAAVIVLITLLVGLLSGLTAGLARQNISAITDLPVDRLVFSDPGGEDLSFTNSTLTREQWRQWDDAPGVASAELLDISTARATAGTPNSPVTASVSLFAVDAGSGLLPGGEQVTAEAAVLSETAADDLSADVGDRVAVNGRELTVTAVRGDDSFGHLPVVWTALSEPAGTVIALNVVDGFDSTAADLSIGTETVTKSDSLSAIGSYTSENGSLQLMQVFLFVISALVVGAFFTVWTVQRSGDIAVLKALGAPTSVLLRDALGQAVVMLTVCTLVGTGLAAALGAVISGSVPFELTLSTVLIPAAVMIALGAAGAALAVRRVTSVDPLIALGSAR